MNLRNNSGKLTSRVKRYHRVTTFRAIVLGLVLTPLLALPLIFQALPQRDIHKGSNELNKWATAPAFAIDGSPEELKQSFDTTHNALGSTQIEREQIISKLETLKQEYASGFVSRAELDEALLNLVDACDDRYIRLLTIEEYEDLFIRTAGKKVGIELSFVHQTETDSFVVKELGDVAERAGIQKGDTFIAIHLQEQVFHIDFLRKAGMSDFDITRALDQVLQSGGRLGSTAKLTLRRGADVYDFSVPRTVIGEEEPIKVSDISVTKHPHGPEPGTAKLITLTYLDAEEFLPRFRETLDSLKKTKNLRGIGLDLTATVGGTKELAVRIAALFMESGVITYEIRPAGDQGIVMNTYFVQDGKVKVQTRGPYIRSQTGNLLAAPTYAETTEVTEWEAGVYAGDLVVGISQNTMGAGELIASALKGEERAVVTGNSLSFGKGMGQKYMQVSPNRVVRFSDSIYLQPDGSSLEAQGVMPNMPVNSAPAFAIRQAMERQFRIVPYPNLPSVFSK